MRYIDLIHKRQAQVNESSLFFAYNKKSLDDQLQEKGLDYSQVVILFDGAFIAKADWPAFKEQADAFYKELQEFLQTEEGLMSALVYELGNHEYCVTYDASDALDALGLSVDAPLVRKVLPKAIKEHLANANF